MIFPAIVVISYNRPKSLQRLLDSIYNARYKTEDITLIISVDKASNAEDVYRVADEFEWKHGKKIVRKFKERQGLKSHVLQCGDISVDYGAVIVLEDDLVVSPDFYNYTCQAVNNYKDDARVAGIALYSHNWNGYSNVSFIPVKNEYDTYYGQFSITWGQCWTDNQWRAFREWQREHDGKLPEVNNNLPSGISNWGKQSWGKYFISYIVENDLYYVIPYVGLSTNFSEAGTHNKRSDNSHQVRLQLGSNKEYRFADYNSSIKYDVFFERIFPEDYKICGIDACEVCVNLNGKKKWNFDKKYLLSARSENYYKIGSFGLRMHPIDQNIDFQVYGDGLGLYDLTKPIEAKNVIHKEDILKRVQYEAFGLTYFQLAPYVKEQFWGIVKEKLRKGKNK